MDDSQIERSDIVTYSMLTKCLLYCGAHFQSWVRSTIQSPSFLTLRNYWGLRQNNTSLDTEISLKFVFIVAALFICWFIMLAADLKSWQQSVAYSKADLEILRGCCWGRGWSQIKRIFFPICFSEKCHSLSECSENTWLVTNVSYFLKKESVVICDHIQFSNKNEWTKGMRQWRKQSCRYRN